MASIYHGVIGFKVLFAHLNITWITVKMASIYIGLQMALESFGPKTFVIFPFVCHSIPPFQVNPGPEFEDQGFTLIYMSNITTAMINNIINSIFLPSSDSIAFAPTAKKRDPEIESASLPADLYEQHDALWADNSVIF